jgi:ribosome-associated heat shock protein Hsp15
VAAKLVPDFAENQTPQEELNKLHVDHLTLFVHREKGTGRPTKKERRQIDFLMNEDSKL